MPVIAQAKHIRSTDWNPHSFLYRGSMKAVDEDGIPVVGAGGKRRVCVQCMRVAIRAVCSGG